MKEPLALGDVLLKDGSLVKGFVGESYGVEGCADISHHGGWRQYRSKATLNFVTCPVSNCDL